ncbi:hypothetical protein ACVWZD_006234 [Streptomyces sp. TE3672]
MSNSGPASTAKWNSGSGCQASEPGVCMKVCVDSTAPTSPRAIARRAVCTPGPRTVPGGGSHPRSGRRRPVEESTCFDRFDGEGLLRPHMPARCDGRRADVGVSGGGIGQVDHCLHSVVGEYVLRTPPRTDAVPSGPVLGPVEGDVADDPYVRVGEPFERGEVLLADGAGADDVDTDRTGTGAHPATRSCRSPVPRPTDGGHHRLENRFQVQHLGCLERPPQCVRCLAGGSDGGVLRACGRPVPGEGICGFPRTVAAQRSRVSGP